MAMDRLYTFYECLSLWCFEPYTKPLPPAWWSNFRYIWLNAYLGCKFNTVKGIIYRFVLRLYIYIYIYQLHQYPFFSPECIFLSKIHFDTKHHWLPYSWFARSIISNDMHIIVMMCQLCIMYCTVFFNWSSTAWWILLPQERAALIGNRSTVLNGVFRIWQNWPFLNFLNIIWSHVITSAPTPRLIQMPLGVQKNYHPKQRQVCITPRRRNIIWTTLERLSVSMKHVYIIWFNWGKVWQSISFPCFVHFTTSCVENYDIHYRID